MAVRLLDPPPRLEEGPRLSDPEAVGLQSSMVGLDHPVLLGLPLAGDLEFDPELPAVSWNRWAANWLPPSLRSASPGARAVFGKREGSDSSRTSAASAAPHEGKNRHAITSRVPPSRNEIRGQGPRSAVSR